MTGLGIEYTISGVPQIEHRLMGIAERAVNAAPVMAAILEDMKRLEAELFDTEGRGEWAPLAPSTIERKAALGYPDKILQGTGDLMGSLTGGSGGVAHATETEAVLGTNVEYATYHQHGTTRMPARPPVDVREEDLRQWSRMIQGFVLGLDHAEIAAAGGGGLPFSLGLTEPFGIL